MVAAEVWRRFGDVPLYAEPFAGSAAMLLGRPTSHPYGERSETINDLDGLVSNFWRALQADPDAVAHYAAWPVNENDLHARHSWLVGQKESLQARLEGDPDWYDAKIGGWWVWGICCWIGGGFCSGKGPWRSWDGLLVRDSGSGVGIQKRLVHLTSKGMGVNCQLVHLSDDGRGVNCQLVHLSDDGDGLCASASAGILAWMQQLADRLRRVRVCCGDWQRILTPCITSDRGVTGVFLDPPYSAEVGRNNDIYTVESLTVAHRVREWCIANGDNPNYRIALCGYDTEHAMPDNWAMHRWSAGGAYGRQGSPALTNRHREVIWFSPHCWQPDAVRQQEVLL